MLFGILISPVYTVNLYYAQGLSKLNYFKVLFALRRSVKIVLCYAIVQKSENSRYLPDDTSGIR